VGRGCARVNPRVFLTQRSPAFRRRGHCGVSPAVEAGHDLGPTTSELTVTDPETQPDPAAEPDTDVHSRAPADAPGEPASRPPSPPSPPSWWRRPTRVQILALVGAFLLGACLCGGLAVVIGTAVFHDGFDRGGDRGSGHGSYERGNDGPRNRNGEGNQKGRGDGELQKPQQIVPPAPPATVAPSPSASLTPAASPS
jgi:hypothetical protein